MAQRQRMTQRTTQRSAPAQPASSRRRVIIPGVIAVAVVAVLLAATLLFKQPTPTAAPTTSSAPGGASASCAVSGAATGLSVGQCAPDFTLDDISGRSVSLSSYLGNPVLLHFWAVACTSCRAEFPDFSRAVSTYTPKGLKVVAVDAWGESAHMVADWQGINHLQATMLVDPSVGVPQQYNGTGTPTTYFIDRNGRIAAKNTGQSTYDYFQQNISHIV